LRVGSLEVNILNVNIWEVNILNVDILNVDILNVDIWEVNILNVNILNVDILNVDIWEVNILNVDIWEVNILNVDILNVDIWEVNILNVDILRVGSLEVKILEVDMLLLGIDTWLPSQYFRQSFIYFSRHITNSEAHLFVFTSKVSMKVEMHFWGVSERREKSWVRQDIEVKVWAESLSPPHFEETLNRKLFNSFFEIRFLSLRIECGPGQGDQQGNQIGRIIAN
jgi:hypothetical protein